MDLALKFCSHNHTIEVSIALGWWGHISYKSRRRSLIVNNAVTAAASPAEPLCLLDAGLALQPRSDLKCHANERPILTFWLHSQQLFATRAYACISASVLAVHLLDAPSSQYKGANTAYPRCMSERARSLDLALRAARSSHVVRFTGWVVWDIRNRGPLVPWV